ncbi:hypothetical protein [Muriicola sp. Z0-33]|uniref:hypothetical protein n=1 Tax=Muriicola sp. Z0-33 TaxID=2816957 RepID=UPI002238733B|nr:hypothetical protein [Muriicola sp. Z0-33]MCW5515245.1 hypothetical protein [Muriicola sp. Z0-33]
MMRALLIIFLFGTTMAFCQEKPIKIVTQELPNRLAFYAVNENEQDLDVMLKIKGTNFRQSSARPRLIRVPATSKVHMKTVVLIRGKRPSYTYDLVVNDSLSRRALKKEYKPVKINPKKQIVVYIPENCQSCDSLIVPLTNGKYLFKMHELGERPEIKDQLNRSFANRILLDSLETPIVNLGGKLFTKIENYDQLLSELKKE